MERAKRADDELTPVVRYAHGYAWRRRMSRQLGVVLGDSGRTTLRGACPALAELAERIGRADASAEALVRELCRTAKQTDSAGWNPAARIAGLLAGHVADPAVAGALRLRLGIQLTGLFCCVTEHRDLLDCPCLRQLRAEHGPAALQRILDRALDDYVAPVNGVWPALTN